MIGRLLETAYRSFKGGVVARKVDQLLSEEISYRNLLGQSVTGPVEVPLAQPTESVS